MRIDVRAAARLSGHDPIDLMSALAPVVGALQAQHRGPVESAGCLPPQAARAKLGVMVAGAAEVRAELGSATT